MDDLYQELENARGSTVLVEGPNDKRSLEKLGFSKVTFLNKPLFHMVERLQESEEILILTDLDEHGRKLYKYFYQEFTRRGVRVNNRLRLLLSQTPVRHIEGLATFIINRERELEVMIE